MATPEQCQEIAARLRELLEASPQSANGVEAWSRRADEIYGGLLREFATARLPVQILHFIVDADIRGRDPEYRVWQEGIMRELLEASEQGTMPPGRGLTISGSPRMIAWCLLVLLFGAAGLIFLLLCS
jgi:hypothetical protein